MQAVIPVRATFLRACRMVLTRIFEFSLGVLLIVMIFSKNKMLPTVVCIPSIICSDDAFFTNEQARAASVFASHYSPLDRHSDASGNYSVLVLSLLLASKDYKLHRLQGNEHDFFEVVDSPDELLVGLILHLPSDDGEGGHYVCCRKEPNGIRYFDSQDDPPVSRLMTYSNLCADIRRQEITIFQVLVHVNHEPIQNDVLAEYDNFLRHVPANARPLGLQAYAQFRETLFISVSK